MFHLQREICKPVLKLDFMAHGKMESLLEFGLRQFLEGLFYINVKNTEQVPHPPCTASSAYEIFGTKIEFNKEIGL